MTTEVSPTTKQPDKFPHLPPGRSLTDRLVQGLRRSNPKLNAYCVLVLIRTHKESDTNLLPLLVVEAACSGKHPNHRVRILDVIQQIGEPLGPSAFFDLMLLASHPVEKVREKAVEVLDALPPSRLPFGFSDIAIESDMLRSRSSR
jgi:hypothetical protein